MIIPKFIKKESVIGVVAPSDGADNELKVKRFKNACSKLESLGYKIKLSDNVIVFSQFKDLLYPIDHQYIPYS